MFAQLRTVLAIMFGGIILAMGSLAAAVMALMGLSSANYCVYAVNWAYHTLIFRYVLGVRSQVQLPQLMDSFPPNTIILVIGVHGSNAEIFEQFFFGLQHFCKRLAACLKWEHQKNLLGFGMRMADAAVFVDRTGEYQNGQAADAIRTAFYRFFTADDRSRTIFWFPEGTRATAAKLTAAKRAGWFGSHTLQPKPGGIAAILQAAEQANRPVVIVSCAVWSLGRTLPSWHALTQLIQSGASIKLRYELVESPASCNVETVKPWLDQLFIQMDGWMADQADNGRSG